MTLNKFESYGRKFISILGPSLFAKHAIHDYIGSQSPRYREETIQKLIQYENTQTFSLNNFPNVRGIQDTRTSGSQNPQKSKKFVLRTIPKNLQTVVMATRAQKSELGVDTTWIKA